MEEIVELNQSFEKKRKKKKQTIVSGNFNIRQYFF